MNTDHHDYDYSRPIVSMQGEFRGIYGYYYS